MLQIKFLLEQLFTNQKVLRHTAIILLKRICNCFLFIRFDKFLISFVMIYWVMKESNINDHWVDLIFSNLILFFPFNLIFFCNISELLSFYRLRKNGVMIVNLIF